MQKQSRAQPSVLSYSRFNTVYQRHQHDKNMLQSIDNLAKISRDIINPLTLPVVLDDNKCEDIAYQAMVHRDACRPNTTDVPQIAEAFGQQQDNEENQCQCGCQNTRGSDLPICIEDQKLKFMGSSVVLNLFFMRVTIGMCLSGLLMYALFNFTTNMVDTGDSLYLSSCNNEIYCLFKINSSLINKYHDSIFTQIQLWLGFVSCLIWIGILRYAKLKAEMIHQDVDKLTQTPSDMAIKFENIPFGECDEEEINEILHKKELQISLNIHDDRSSLKIKAIHIVYNMSEVRLMIESIRKQAIELSKLLKDGEDGKIQRDKEDEYRNKKMKLIQSLQSLEDFKKRFLNEKLFRRKLATTCAIIEFRSEFGKTHFLKKFGTTHMGVLDQIRLSLKRLCYKQTDAIMFKGQVLRVQRAPEPQDILWENCEYQYSLLRIVLIWFVTFIIICVSLGIIVGLQFLQQRIAEDPQFSDRETLLGYVISVALMIINQLIWVVLFWLIKIEYNHSVSDEVISRVNKTVILQSLNCIVLPMISSLLIETGSKVKGPFDGLVLVSGQALDYSISNCLIPVVLLYFDPLYIIKSIVLYIVCIRNKIVRYLSRTMTKTQNFSSVVKVNEFYEGGDFDITSTYVYLVANILHAAFYCTLQPFIMFLATLGTTLFFLVKKYLLLRRYTAPKMLSKLVFNNALVGLSYVPVFYAIGSLVFVSVINDFKIQALFWIPSCLSLGVAFINIINPGSMFDKLTSCIHGLFNPKTVAKTHQAHNQSNEMVNNPPTIMSENVIPAQKGTPESLTDQFRRNAQYYFFNHISTLFGFKYMLLGKPINDEVRKNVKAFVMLFGEEEEDPYQYPDIGSQDTGVLQKLRIQPKDGRLVKQELKNYFAVK